MLLCGVTELSCIAAPLRGANGDELVVAVVKASFLRDRSGRLFLADHASPIYAGDVATFPDAEESSVRYPADTAVRKVATDVVVVGEAVSPTPVLAADVAVRVRDRCVALRVHGDRMYTRGLTGVCIGPASPFLRKPVVYELAYGGKLADGSALDPRNPVGRGFALDVETLMDTPAPQIEDPARPIGSARDRPVPVGFGALAAYWSPRRELAGTFDAAWREQRMPLVPLDYDPRHDQVAPPALQFEPHLTAGEAIGIQGMTEDGRWDFVLPELALRISGRRDDGSEEVARPAVDTVLVETTAGRVDLSVRHAFRVGRGKTLLREIRVVQDG